MSNVLEFKPKKKLIPLMDEEQVFLINDAESDIGHYISELETYSEFEEIQEILTVLRKHKNFSKNYIVKE